MAIAMLGCPMVSTVRGQNPSGQNPTGQGWSTQNPFWQSKQDQLPENPATGQRPYRIPASSKLGMANPKLEAELNIPMRWWTDRVKHQVTDSDRWVSFDLQTLLLDTLNNSPRILGVAHETSATFQRIIQQDAAFDSTLLLGGNLGSTNDPVGNTLTTGGAERLREKSMNLSGGARQLTRRGTEIEWSQEFGFLDSNSSFFVPRDQGNARLNLSLTKPLLSRGDKYYNERLVTQARIESRVSWQEMRGEVEQRIADVISAYWQLYEIRAQLSQQRELLSRSQEIERLLISRQNFDAARIEIAKAKQRVARRTDQVIELEAELRKQQTRLAVLVGSDPLLGSERNLELIPMEAPQIMDQSLHLRDAVAQALENRPEIRAATQELALSALEMRVTRVELEPQLNWVFNGYLSQLNGASKVAKSFGEQFENAPGVSTGLEFEMPRGRRAVRAQQREALNRYRLRSEELREAIKQAQFEVETALIDIEKYTKQKVSKTNVLARAREEESILRVQWQLIGGDGSRIGIKLETLLDAQQRRTEAEKDLVAAESGYMISLVQLQRAMGTLLIEEGINPQQSCTGDVDFLSHQSASIATEPSNLLPPSFPQDSLQDEETPVYETPVDEAPIQDTPTSPQETVNEANMTAIALPPEPFVASPTAQTLPAKDRIQLPSGWDVRSPSHWQTPSQSLTNGPAYARPSMPPPQLKGSTVYPSPFESPANSTPPRSAWRSPAGGW